MDDHVGQRFGKLVVTAEHEVRTLPNGKKSRFWKCQCDCGGFTFVRRAQLINENTKSCGCGKADNARRNFTKHGHSTRNVESPTYYSWHNMIKRCTMPSCNQFANYGGRGIKVCEEWLTFSAFLADMGERPDGMTIDRIDPNGDYKKTNCRWAAKQEQARNRTDNRILEHEGKSLCISAWANELGISESSLRCRIDRYGWSVERALSTYGKTKCIA